MNKPYIHGMLPDVPDTEEQKPEAEQLQIRYMGDMQRLQPQLGDVFVLTSERLINAATAERIKAELSRQLGGATVVVLDGGMKLGAVAPQLQAPVVHNFTVGDVATCDKVRNAIRRNLGYSLDV